jgi:hypothetical protein
MRDLVTIDDFNKDFVSADDIAYTDNERVDLQNVIGHIITEHSEMFDQQYKLRSNLFDLTVSAIFVEHCHGLVYVDSRHIAALAEARHHADECASSIVPFALAQLIGEGHMEITGLCYGTAEKLWLKWSPVAGSRISTTLTCLMSIEYGGNADGFTSIPNLLELLRRWDAIADVVGISNGATDLMVSTFSNHFRIFGDIHMDSVDQMHISPRSFDEIIYTVIPMWSPHAKFRSTYELASFLTSPKPDLRPKALDIDRNLFRSLPRGNNDYVVAFDTYLCQWAVLFSARLGIYYKVTVHLYGTKLDDSPDLHAALKIRKSPYEYI